MGAGPRMFNKMVVGFRTGADESVVEREGQGWNERADSCGALFTLSGVVLLLHKACSFLPAWT